jgi:hypothetical protein
MSADLGRWEFQFQNWVTSAGTGMVQKWGPTYTLMSTRILRATRCEDCHMLVWPMTPMIASQQDLLPFQQKCSSRHHKSYL